MGTDRSVPAVEFDYSRAYSDRGQSGLSPSLTNAISDALDWQRGGYPRESISGGCFVAVCLRGSRADAHSGSIESEGEDRERDADSLRAGAEFSEASGRSSIWARAIGVATNSKGHIFVYDRGHQTRHLRVRSEWQVRARVRRRGTVRVSCSRTRCGSIRRTILGCR